MQSTFQIANHFTKGVVFDYRIRNFLFLYETIKELSQFSLKKILIDTSTIKLIVYQDKERFRFPILLKFICVYYIFVYDSYLFYCIFNNFFEVRLLKFL